MPPEQAHTEAPEPGALPFPLAGIPSMSDFVEGQRLSLPFRKKIGKTGFLLSITFI